MTKPTLDYFELRGYKEFLSSLRVNVNLTNACNNNCWYCNGHFQNVKTPKYLKKEQFKELLDFINYQDREMIYMTLIGGEPTLNKNLSYCMRKADKELRRKEIYVITNLLRSLNYFKKLPLRDKGFHFICSYHSHAIKDYKEWFEKIDYLYEKRCLNTVFLMLTQHNIDEIKKVYEKFKDRYNSIWESDENVLNVYAINEFGYSEEYKKLCQEGIFDHYNTHDDCRCGLNEDNVKVILSDGTSDKENYHKYNDFFMMLCLSGLQVHSDGVISRCVHSREAIHWLGKKQKMHKFSKWYLCKKHRCKCDLDFPKASVDYYLKHFKGKVLSKKLLFGESIK